MLLVGLEGVVEEEMILDAVEAAFLTFFPLPLNMVYRLTSLVISLSCFETSSGDKECDC